ncbi:MAG: PstS family phosphate ABC transporter substrate-binding protein [Prolixibacteraceae bacterium]|nr:PstS family phosphate ABC transporter substrate-binding protein [Prolixibacteraceae bacterium]
MKKLSVIAIVLLLAFTQCASPSKKNIESNNGQIRGYISLSGAFALYPITVLWADEFRKENPGVKIDISAGGAGKGMADALSQMVDLGMFSREVSPEEISKGAWFIALTKDAVLPTINAGNPYLSELKQKGIDKEKLIRVFVTGEITSWEALTGRAGNTPIHLYTRSDACGAASMWGVFLGTSQEELLGTGVFGDPGVADAVKSDRLGLGYNNVNYVYDITSRKKFDNLEVLPLDLNSNGSTDSTEIIFETLDDINKAIIDGIYPSPPARDLYFVSFGKPTKPEVVAFIEWILTKGQQYVSQAGYVQLTEEKIEQQMLKLKSN